MAQSFENAGATEAVGGAAYFGAAAISSEIAFPPLAAAFLAVGIFEAFDPFGGSDKPSIPFYDQAHTKRGRHDVYPYMGIQNIVDQRPSASEPPEATSQTHSCSGEARILQGNSSTIGKAGGLSTPNNSILVAPNSAAVIPGQFGNKAQLRMNGSQISGSLGGTPLFSGVTDVVGGESPIPGVPVRRALQQLNPGMLILELPSSYTDLGTAEVTITVPNGMPCPAGTQ